jgi:hypothetical protein
MFRAVDRGSMAREGASMYKKSEVLTKIRSLDNDT